MFPSFCKITGNSRSLPKPQYFPILPPITPKQAKQFQQACRITSNFNPDHHYVPITKLLMMDNHESSAGKCRITEKSVYEYKYFLQMSFGDCIAHSKHRKTLPVPGSGNKNTNGSSTNGYQEDHEFFYYEIDPDKVLILPVSVEKELNCGAIKEVQISHEQGKIGIRYINTIKEYDLTEASQEEGKSIIKKLVKGKGLKKLKRQTKKRKKSALLGDLKSIFEQKEKLAELAEKKAQERIQPDAGKMDKVKNKITRNVEKVPVFGYMDGNQVFHEIMLTSEDKEVPALPKGAVKGEMVAGTFTPGELINDIFIPGKYDETTNTFIPGVINNNEDGFIPGSYIERDLGNGKKEKKFIPGKRINGVFTPGQMIKTRDGTRSEFVPGQVLTLENGSKKFVPGLIIAQKPTVEDWSFVPGMVEETRDNSLVFTPGEVVETPSGLKFICEKVGKDFFEIQGFDSALDFDYEDVKAAATVCDQVHEFVKGDGGSHSSYDGVGDTGSICTVNSASALTASGQTSENPSRKASIDFLEQDTTKEGDEETVIHSLPPPKENGILNNHGDYHEHEEEAKEIPLSSTASPNPVQNGNLQEQKTQDVKLLVETVLKKVEAQAAPLIQKICLEEINLSSEQASEVVQQVIQALKNTSIAAASSLVVPSTSHLKIDSSSFCSSSEEEVPGLIIESLIMEHVVAAIQPIVEKLQSKLKGGKKKQSRFLKNKEESSSSGKSQAILIAMKELVSKEVVQVNSQILILESVNGEILEKHSEQNPEQAAISHSQVDTQKNVKKKVQKNPINHDKIKEITHKILGSQQVLVHGSNAKSTKIIPLVEQIVMEVLTEIEMMNTTNLQEIDTPANMKMDGSSGSEGIDKLKLMVMEGSLGLLPTGVDPKPHKLIILKKVCDVLKLGEIKDVSPHLVSEMVEKVVNEVVKFNCESENGNQQHVTPTSPETASTNGQNGHTHKFLKKIPLPPEHQNLLLASVISDCKNLLISGYNEPLSSIINMSESGGGPSGQSGGGQSTTTTPTTTIPGGGEGDVKAANLLKDHVQTQLIRELNEALLEEALQLARIMGKVDIVKELETLLQDDINYDTVMHDAEILFILRQLVILKKLINAKQSSQGNSPTTSLRSAAPGGFDLRRANRDLIRDSEILTEYVFAEAEEEKEEREGEEKWEELKKLKIKKEGEARAKQKVERSGVTVFAEESSSFFSSADGSGTTTTAQSKKSRINQTDYDEPHQKDDHDDESMEFDAIAFGSGLLDNTFARHKIEMARHLERHSPSPNPPGSTKLTASKIALKSADELEHEKKHHHHHHHHHLESCSAEQLALINREATLRELIETEEEFVQDLGFVIDNYYKTLINSGTKWAKYRELFGSLKPIYDFHQGILLEGFRYYVNEPRMIGRTFLRLVSTVGIILPQNEIYEFIIHFWGKERYFDNHAEYISEEEPNAQGLLRDDSEIAEYFEELTLKLGDEKVLSDHLKLPLQRINDYQLILQDLIDIQRILGEETGDLEKALDLLLSIPQKISDKKFLSNIEGLKGDVFHLGRLLRHDWFTVTREDVNEVKQRYAFLFKSRILVTKVRKISEDRSVFVLKDIIKLPEYTLEVINDQEFILKGTTNTRTYIFQSPSETAGAEWVELIQQTLQPEIAVAQRTEESLRQLKREGSTRRSSRSKRRRASEQLQLEKKDEKPLGGGVSIQEISTEEAKSLEQRQTTHTIKPQPSSGGGVEVFTSESSFEKKSETCVEVEVVGKSSDGEIEESKSQVKVVSESKIIEEGGEQGESFYKQSTELDQVSPSVVTTTTSTTTAGQISETAEAKDKVNLAVATSESAEQEGTFQTDVGSSTKASSLLSVASSSSTKAEASVTSVSSAEEQETVVEASSILSQNQPREASEQEVKAASIAATEEKKEEVVSKKQTSSETKQQEEAANTLEQEQVKTPPPAEEQPKPRKGILKKYKSESIKSQEEEVKSQEQEGISRQSSVKQEEASKEVQSVEESLKKEEKVSESKSEKVEEKSKQEEKSSESTSKGITKKQKSLEKGEPEVGKVGESIERKSSVNKQKQEKSESAEDTTTTTDTNADPEELRKLRRRSSVIRRKSLIDTDPTMAASVVDGASPAPPPVFSQPVKSIECEPGDNATLECVTERPVIINWLKGNRPLDDTLADRVKITTKGNKHTLTILNCRDEDSGLYTAKITDEKFGVATSSAVISVHELSPEERQKKIQDLNSPQFLVRFKDTELLKDTRVSFMFVVKGNPEPTLTFYHDGMILQEETDRTKILKQPDDTYEFAIERISDDDAGEYKVVAENKHGKTEVTAKVRVVDEKELFRGIEGKHLLNPGEEPSFDWFLNGRPFTPDEKLKVLFREEEDTLALVFQHVTPEDAGLYTCVAQTSGGKISCSAELTVQGAIHQLLKEPAPPSILAELTDTEVSVGGSAMMELKVSGYPKPQVTWYKDGKEELVAGGRFRFLYEDDESIALIIKNVTTEDAGLYVVKAVNDLGEVETKGRLIVKAPPRFVKKMVDMACMTEAKLAMEVIVEGSPKPEVKWYKDGQLIIASERIKFTELEGGRFQLTIERVTLEDSGAYSVVASNAIGQMSEFWNLLAQQPAKISKKLEKEVTVDLGTKASQLKFSVEGVPEPKITCTTSDGKQLKVESLGSHEYRLTYDATERKNFKIKVEAKNEFGSDSCESQINVRRSAQIVTKLQNIEATEGDEVTVKVKVDSYPKPSKVKWFIDGVEISGKKYEQGGGGDDGEYSLKIKGVEKGKDDSNKLNVTVKAENELGSDECSASITIKSKPKIKKGLDAKYRLVDGSKNQELNVEVDSATFPEPKGKWFHNGKEVSADARIKISKKSSETYNLTFNVVKYEDAGEWSFKAENEVGEVWSKTTIIVEGKPTFKKGLPEKLEVIESEKMEIDVIVQDFCEENVKITWTLDTDVTLESTEVREKEENCTKSKIIFVPTGGCQKLTVTAVNKHGESETRSELVHVCLNPPVIKKPLEKEQFIKDGAKNVKLSIEVEGMPPPKIKWCLNGEPVLEGTNAKELIIPVFSQANVGQYSVEVSNVAGSVSCSGAVKMLQTKPSFGKGLEPAYTFKEGLEDLVLTVDVDGSPIPTVVWMKDGEPISPETDPRVSITNADGKSTLRVKDINPKDKGRYSCVIKNPNGTAETSSNVGIKPTPRSPLLVEPLEYPKDVNRKEKLQIKTKIDGEPMPNVTFLHNGKPLSPTLWKLLPDGTLTLTIDNVQPENQGVYTLRLENEAGVKEVETEPITVHEPPQRPGIEPPLGTIKVVEGLPFKFTAGVKGFPLPELVLEKDGVEVPQQAIIYDKEKKQFEYGKGEAKPEDAGVYKLTAKNASGQIASEGKLDVVCKTKEGPKYEPKFIYELCDRAVDEGNELLLMAKVDGNPLPAIRWEFNGEPLSAKEYPQTFDGEKAILRIPVAERNHQGLYKCILENDEGKAESGSNVTVNKVYRPPSFTQKFTDQEQVPSGDCKFGARIGGIPVPTAKWFKDGVELTPGDKYRIKQDGDIVQLQVRNCTDVDKGIYTCQLSNREGTAECKAKLDVVKELTYKPRGEIPYFLKTIGNTEVYPGMTAKFTACVGGFPDPEYAWFRNGTDKVFESDRIRFERDGVGSGLLRLIIKDVCLGDLADYTLKIWNEHGDAECSAYLKYDSLADLNKQKLGELYSGYEDTRPTAIPNRPLITYMNKDSMTLKWDPCLPHASRIPCTYLVEMCPVNEPDNWSTLYKGLKNTYCDVEFPNPNLDYKFRIRVQWGPTHISEPSPYAITMRNRFDTRPPQWKPQLVPSIPRAYDLSRPPHEGYTHPPRFLNREIDYQYAQLGAPSSLHFAVYGFPKPSLKFYKDGREISLPHTYLDNGLITIFINRMTDDMEGDWECEARNSLGVAQQKVHLRRADHPKFIKRPKETYAMSRRSVKITCRVYGIPIPDIKVYKDWHLLPLTCETRVKLILIEIDQYTVDIHISIEEAMMRDEGLYSIVATNVAGSVHSSAMIHVEESEYDYYFKSNLKGKDVRFRNMNIRNYYDWGEEIGRGTQGIHHHVVERASGGSYASKTLITRYDPRRKEWVESEYNVWNGLNHRHISRLHDAFYWEDTYIFISDICTGGDLLYNLIHRESFTEYEICFLIKQILEGLDYLHVQQHVSHLSLTPLDLLFTHINSSHLRIIDFGLARKNWTKTLEYGQPEFVAPEIVRKDNHIGPWCDMWALGIITYILLSGHSPFLGQNDRETLENVKNGSWTFGERFELISSEAQDFIKRLLVYDYKDRIDVQASLSHPWFNMLMRERTEFPDLPNILRDSHSSYYYKLKAWNDNASCRTIFRRNPLETAYTDPSRMVYPPGYNDDDDYKLPIPSTDHLKLNGFQRPEIDDFVSESHYSTGDETYLLQLRDTDFPTRMRQYMRVAASHSPAFQFNIYNRYCERNIPVIRERRKFTDIADEEVDDEKTKTYPEGVWNPEPRRIKYEVGTRLDIQADADALRAMKQDGREPVFRERPPVYINVRSLGQEIELKVVAAGDPVPTIQWFKNDMMVMVSGEHREVEEEEGVSILRFKELQETDLTNYKVVVRNKSGQIISRFRLRIGDEPLGVPEPPELNLDIEENPVNISTSTEALNGPLELLSVGRFGSVILSENKRLLKICTELEFNTTRKMMHINVFSVQQAWQVGSSILVEDTSGLGYPETCNLLAYISSLDSYNEQLLMNFVTQILDGLQYIHWHGLALLNLEPGNVLVTKDNRIKLADFSAAQPVLKIGSQVDCLTEPEFTAPEVLNGESQCMPQTDTWNVGVLLYIMLSGASPFLGGSDDETRQNVTFVRFHFEPMFHAVSQEATRLIMLMFKRSPLKRPTADECLEHRWFQLSEHMAKKREKAVFETTKIREYYAHYLERRKALQGESNLQDFTSKYGNIE